MLNAAVRRTNQRWQQESWLSHQVFWGPGPTFEVARRVADSKRVRLSRGESSLLRDAAVNAVWTKCRLKEAGYESETSLCDMCGQEEDTLWHRVWFCKNPQVVAARNRFASATLETEATKENADLLWVTRAVTDASDNLRPPSAKDLAVMPKLGTRAPTMCARSAMVAAHKSSRARWRAHRGSSSSTTRRARRWRATSVPSLHIQGSPARQGNREPARCVQVSCCHPTETRTGQM